MTEEKFETLKIFSDLPLIQAKREKELRLRTLMPSVPVLSLSKGWIGCLRGSCEVACDQ
jgi:hypothetical protein